MIDFLATLVYYAFVSGGTYAFCWLVIHGLRETRRSVRRRRVKRDLDAYTRQYNLEREAIR